jgi:hypothetical protein
MEKNAFEKRNFYLGRMISGSKSGYRRAYPDNDVLFNANIFSPSGRNKWYGDLDITKDAKVLQEICDELQEELIVVPEMLGRFGAEERKYKLLEADAHTKFIPNEKEYLSRVYDGMHGVTIDNMTIVTSKGVDWKRVKY